jgi:alcohol dehydrogenase
LNHWSGVSTFAEYAVAAQESLVKIDPTIPLETASVLGCAVVTGVGAVVNSAAVRPGDSVAVLGLGGVGLSAIMGAVVAGASQIVAIDIAEHKLVLAKELGATEALDARDPQLVDRVQELTRGGVDYAFEMSGVQASVANAYAITARGGAVVMSSLPPPDRTFAIPLSAHVAEEKRFIGSYMGSSWAQRDIPRYVDLYLAGRLPIDRLQSSASPLTEINEGFDRLATGEAVRDVITF